MLTIAGGIILAIIILQTAPLIFAAGLWVLVRGIPMLIGIALLGWLFWLLRGWSILLLYASVLVSFLWQHYRLGSLLRGLLP